MRIGYVFVLMLMLFGGLAVARADQGSENQQAHFKALSEELAGTSDPVRRNELKLRLGSLLPTGERPVGPDHLDQGGEGWWDATVLPGDPAVTVSGTTVGWGNDFSVADAEFPPNPCWEGYFDQFQSCAGPDVAYRYTVPTDGQYRMNLCNGPHYDSGLLVYSFTGGPPNNFTDLICGNDDYCTLTSQLTTPLLFAGQELLVVVDGWGASAGPYLLEISLTNLTPPPNDLCFGAQFIEPFTAVTGTTIDASLDDVVSCGTSVNTPGVWYATIGSGNTMTASTCLGSDYDTKISVYTGDCTNPICVGGNDDACGLGSSVAWCSVAGQVYHILVHGFGGQTGNFTLDLQDNGVACTPTLKDVYEVYQNYPALVGQTITIEGVITDPEQSLLVHSSADYWLNQALRPYSAIKIVGPSSWGYVPPFLWGEYGIVTGVLQIDPAPENPLVFLTLEINAPVQAAPVRPSLPQAQANWRPANWTPDTTNCDSCLFGVLISGGIDSANNRADYWEDLIDYYCYKASSGYCPRNIRVFYFKGDARDNRLPASAIQAATLANVQAAINAISSKVKACKAAGKSPKVEVMTTNHGEEFAGANLLGSDILYATDFTAMIQTLIDSGAAEIEVEMGQCYGGEMVEDLENGLVKRGAKVTAASAAPNDAPSWSKAGPGGWNRWLNPLVCARVNGASLPEAIRQANVSYEDMLVRMRDYFVAMAAYFDSLRTHADSLRADTMRTYGGWAGDGIGGETTWYNFSLRKRCQGDTIAVMPGGRLEFTFEGPATACGNCEIKCKNTAGQWVSYRNWNWNVPGSKAHQAGNDVRTLDAGAGHTGLYVIHSRSDSFNVAVKAVSPPLPPLLTTDPSNPETFAGFSVGWTSGNADEFGDIVAFSHMIPDVDDDGFNMSTSPRWLGSGGVEELSMMFDIPVQNYWWTNMNLYFNVLLSFPGGVLDYDCPECSVPSGQFTLSGGQEEFIMNVGAVLGTGQKVLTLRSASPILLDCWGLESAHSTGIPPAVTDLTVLRVGNDVRLFWNDVPVALSYLVQSAPGVNGPWSDLGMVNMPGFVHANQVNQVTTQVYYQVIAVGP
ncbi:MAG: hypothetical protein IPH10_09825 [bacterium]|nr:hypothetical protein [bacterium]